MSDQHSDGGRILVTGSRTWDDVDTIRSVLAHWWVITAAVVGVLGLGPAFVAPAPQGQRKLDFVAKEEAILTAVGDTPTRVGASNTDVLSYDVPRTCMAMNVTRIGVNG